MRHIRSYHMYKLVDILADGLVALSSEYGKQLWCSCKTRKEHKCQECEQLFSIGSAMYRPITNGYNRMQRLCEDCIRYLGIVAMIMWERR